MIIKYATIKLAAYESGRIYISPELIFDDEKKAKDRAQFGVDAYKEPHVVLELRPIEVERGA